MRRRRLLATLPLAAGLSGCGGLALDADEATPTATTPTTTGTAPSSPASDQPDEAQFVSVKNTRSSDVYLTLVVEGETTFVESLELFPGEEVRFPAVVGTDAEREVVLETTDGERATYQWQPTAELDGLATYLTTGGVEFWRHTRCLSTCPVAEADESTASADLPLVGDGTGRWYAPAGVVVQNPASTTRAVDLTVSLREQRLLARRYRLPGETQLSLPVTYRSGEYVVDVGVGDRTATNVWPVPQVPERHVVLGEQTTFGCGPANTALTLSNRDSVEHTLSVRLSRDGRALFDRRVTVAAKTDRRFVPVDESGPYEVTVETESVEGSDTATATWWACPPRGPATVFVDATGSVTLRQGGPRPG
jgi:hypothetical protein